ncbi:MAG: hypothetical protein ACRYGF_05150 [Janthinobacterium lividum]
MATLTTLPVARQRTRRSRITHSPSAFLVLCTCVALLLLGYHPAAEDGGIYAAAAAFRLQPSLFPAERGFALAHTTRSLFIPLLDSVVRLLHWRLPVVLLLLHAISTALTLTALWALSKLFFSLAAHRRSGVLLCAVALGMPVAGTSLYLADPYLTARSISTPLLLFCLLFLIRRQTWAFLACITVSLALHPMMSGWALVLFAAFVACRSKKPLRNALLLAAAVLLGMAAVHWLGPIDAAAAREASATRDYWYPARWAWFELVGLAAPPIVLLFLLKLKGAEHLSTTARQTASAAVLAVCIVGAGALCFIHVSDRSLLLARMQPLRLLHIVYLLFLLLLGGWMASVPRLRHLRWAALVVASFSLLMMQRQLYSHSHHIELPGMPTANGYTQAFVWARDNTPVDALFALDADYTTSPGEDAQLFRAVALRSSLPDAAKDGGISSVMPALAEDWARGMQAQAGLAHRSDAERVARVGPLGATWIVLPATSETHFRCPYRNSAAQVCKLP